MGISLRVGVGLEAWQTAGKISGLGTLFSFWNGDGVGGIRARANCDTC